jgi:hypothetical protein
LTVLCVVFRGHIVVPRGRDHLTVPWQSHYLAVTDEQQRGVDDRGAGTVKGSPIAPLVL